MWGVRAPTQPARRPASSGGIGPLPTRAAPVPTSCARSPPGRPCRPQEAGVMARMRHPGLVSFMGLCTLPPCLLTGARGQLLGLGDRKARHPRHASALARTPTPALPRHPSSMPRHRQSTAPMAASTTPSSRRRSRSRWRRSCPGRAACRSRWTPPAACCTCTSPPRPSSTATVRRGACSRSCMKPAHDCPGAASVAAGCTAAGAVLSTPHDVPLCPAPPTPTVKSPNILLDDSWHAKVGQLAG